MQTVFAQKVAECGVAVMRELQKQGYDKKDIDKVSHKNALSFFNLGQQ